METPKSISVLIANYNWSVTALVQELHRQLTAANVTFEILCYDNSKDSKFEKENLELNTLEGVTYLLEHHQIGRSQNRNKLALDSKLDWLLFLDGDSAIAKPNFIDCYLKTSNGAPVVCGGTAYAEKPDDQNNFLRWTYGKTREELPAEVRNKKANSGFSSFNFLIKKEAFDLVRFDNQLTQYGHEDTLLGEDLERHHFNVLHIQNTLVHLGLDSNQKFLEKTRKGLENFKQLIDSGILNASSSLAVSYLILKKSRLKFVAKTVFKRYEKKWESNLCGPNPNLKTFDFYKLGYLCAL